MNLNSFKNYVYFRLGLSILFPNYYLYSVFQSLEEEVYSPPPQKWTARNLTMKNLKGHRRNEECQLRQIKEQGGLFSD